MNFPNRGAPATRPSACKTTIVICIVMVIVGHQLPNDLYLLSLERLHAVNRPVGMTRGSRVRRHFTDDAVLLQLAKGWCITLEATP